jgi:hypothetical protein
MKSFSKYLEMKSNLFFVNFYIRETDFQVNRSVIFHL